MNTSNPEQHGHRVLVAAVRAVQEVHHYGVDDVLVALTCVCRKLHPEPTLRPALGKEKVPAGRGYTKKPISFDRPSLLHKAGGGDMEEGRRNNAGWSAVWAVVPGSSLTEPFTESDSDHDRAWTCK